jgi:3-dehydroquinate synthase II
MSSRQKDIIVKVGEDAQESELKHIADRGISTVICPGRLIASGRNAGLACISAGPEADWIMITDPSSIDKSKASKPYALAISIRSLSDMEVFSKAVKVGVDKIIVGTGDWRIIPLENMIAEAGNSGSKIYTTLNSEDELPTLYGILEKGVDGVIVDASKLHMLDAARSLVERVYSTKLVAAKVTETSLSGMGDRACIDTATLLKMGEGLLIGSRSGFLFLIHNESVGSEFTSPRPFRVNAGALHSYILMPTGKTRYLSELSAGDEVLVVNSKGTTSPATIGRVKIERRPLKIVKAQVGDEVGTALVQNAETIRFISPEGNLIPVTSLKAGDNILVHVSEIKARHFGMAVDEQIIER